MVPAFCSCLWPGPGNLDARAFGDWVVQSVGSAKGEEGVRVGLLGSIGLSSGEDVAGQAGPPRSRDTWGWGSHHPDGSVGGRAGRLRQVCT